MTRPNPKPSSNNLDDYPTVGLLFPSEYLSADDLRGQDRNVVIEAIAPRDELKRVDGAKDYKPVVTLRGAKKRWVLNVTNAKTIAKLYGRDARQWIGKPITIYATMVQSFGEMVPAIRVRPDAPQAARAEAK
jgi:hypothetical protein